MFVIANQPERWGNQSEGGFAMTNRCSYSRLHDDLRCELQAVEQYNPHDYSRNIPFQVRYLNFHDIQFMKEESREDEQEWNLHIVVHHVHVRDGMRKTHT